MGRFTLTHEIRCNADTFWKTFFDKSFNETLFRQRLGFPEYTIVDQRETETEIVRKVTGTPKMNMPGPVMKLLGSGFGYTEEGRLNKATQVWSWKTIPSTLAEKLRSEGTLRIEPIGDNKVRRITEIVIEAKVFGVGGLIESSTEKQMREGWEQSAVYMNEVVAGA